MATTTVEQFAESVRGALGARAVSIVLFGSAARRGLAGPADTLVICDRVDPGVLAALADASRAWLKDGHPAPLVFGEAEWRDSADVFAIEMTDMRAHHRLLAGRDPWAGVAVRDEDVRRQLEHELRGKVVRLRQAFVGAAREGRAPRLGPDDPVAAAYLAAVTRTAQYVNDLPTRSDGR